MNVFCGSDFMILTQIWYALMVIFIRWFLIYFGFGNREKEV